MDKPTIAPLDMQIEKAIRIVAKHMPDSTDAGKPVLLHSIRVGMYLHHHDYPDDVVLGGLLHDVIEDTNLEHRDLANHFSTTVADIVLANSKDTSIADRIKRYSDVVERCQNIGSSALVVKAADILDNLWYYKQHSIQKEIDYCRASAKPLLDLPAPEIADPIFNRLRLAVDTA